MTRRVVIPGMLLGLGLGAIFDVIVFHAILQWHHLASGRIPPDTVNGLAANVRLDGTFMIVMWIVAVVALVLLWRARGGVARGGVVAGAALIGWGAFNVYDVVVDHYVLGLHHTTHGPDAGAWDVVIAAWGVAFIVAGWLLVRRSAADVAG